MKSLKIINKEITVDVVVILSTLILFALQIPIGILFSYVVPIFYIFYERMRSDVPLKYLGGYFCVVVVLLPSVFTFNHGLTPVFYLLLSPFLLYAGYIFSLKSLMHIRSVLMNVYCISAFIVVIGLIINWNEPEPLGAILPWASTNGIPSYLIVVQIGYSISYFLEKNKLPLLSSVVTLVVAIFGLGRGSIIIAILILSITLMLNLLFCKPWHYRLLGMWLISIFFVFLLIAFESRKWGLGDGLINWVEGSKFATGIVDEHRLMMIEDYLRKIDGVSLMFGAGYDGTAINDYYGGNPHNSFIRMHSFYGSAALFGLMMPLILILVSNRVLIQKIIVLCLIVLALLRATSEPIFFPTTLDFFYFLYFAIFFRFSKSKS